MKYDGEKFELGRREAWRASVDRTFSGDALQISQNIRSTEKITRSCSRELEGHSFKGELNLSQSKSSEKIKKRCERQIEKLSQAVMMMTDHEWTNQDQQWPELRVQPNLNDEAPRFGD